MAIPLLFVRTNTAAMVIIVVSLPFTSHLFGTPPQFATLFICLVAFSDLTPTLSKREGEFDFALFVVRFKFKGLYFAKS